MGVEFPGKADYGLSFVGIVTTATDTTHFKASDLTDFGDGYFIGYHVYVTWDVGGAGAAPQGEHQLISAYTSSNGTFTHAAFSAQLALTDKVVIVHPSIGGMNVSCMMFSSAPSSIVVIPGTGADLDFPSVTVAGLPAGCNILRVDMSLVIGALFDTSASENQIKTGTTDQLFVKLSSDAWSGGAGVVDKCLDFPALGLQVGAGAYRAGAILEGATDIKAVVDANGTYNFRSEETNKTKGVEATGASLELLDVSTLIRVWFS